MTVADHIDTGGYKILLHAPSVHALQRARSNAANILREHPETELRIMANAEAVFGALDTPNPGTDTFTWLCINTLRRAERECLPPFRTTSGSSIFEMARLQREGWVYIRA